MINFFFQLFMMRVKQGEIKKGSETQLFSEPYLRTPSGIRTLDPLIKSQLLSLVARTHGYYAGVFVL